MGHRADCAIHGDKDEVKAQVVWVGIYELAHLGGEENEDGANGNCNGEALLVPLQVVPHGAKELVRRHLQLIPAGPDAASWCSMLMVWAHGWLL